MTAQQKSWNEKEMHRIMHYYWKYDCVFWTDTSNCICSVMRNIRKYIFQCIIIVFSTHGENVADTVK